MEILFHTGRRQILLRSRYENFELCQTILRKDPNTGAITTEWQAFKWFSTLVGAFDALLTMKVRESDVKSISELKEAIANFRKELQLGYDCASKVSVSQLENPVDGLLGEGV